MTVRADDRPIALALAGFGTSTAVLQLSRLIVSMAVAASLGPARWGVWQIISVLLVYGAMSHLGMLNAMNREIPKLRGAGREDEAHDLQAVSLGGMLVGGGVCGLLGLVGVLLFASEGVRELALPALALFAAQQVMTYVMMAARSNVRFAIVSVIQGVQALMLPLIVLPMALHLGLRGFLLGNALAIVVTCGLVLHRVPGPKLPRIDWSRMRDLVRIGFPILGAGIAHMLLITSDRWIAGGMLGGVSLGHYGIVALVLSGLMMIAGVLKQFMYPRMARAWGATGDPNVLVEWGRRQMRLGFLVIVPATLGSILIFPEIIWRFLPDYEAAIPALRLALPFVAIQPLAAGYGAILNILDRQKLHLLIQCGALVFNVALSVALVLTEHGITGVALGTTLSFAMYVVALRIAGRRVCRLVKEA